MVGTVNIYSGSELQPYRNPEQAKGQVVQLPGGVNYPAGQVMGLVPGTGTAVNEVQTITITGTPTGGTFKLGFGDQVTAAIAYNATAAAVQAALEAHSNIGTGNVTGGGGALPGTAVTATFVGALAGRNVPMLVVVSPALTGGTAPAVAITETTAGKQSGGFWKNYDNGASDGSEVARGLLRYPCETNPDGTVKSLSPDGFGGPTGAFVFTSGGDYLTSELTGIDAAGVTDLGRIVGGIPGTLTDTSTILHMN
jgi:hypothetical protein